MGAKFPDAAPDGLPAVRAPAAMVVDLDDDRILYDRAADTPRPIASLSKLVAALTLVDAGLELDAVTRITRADARAARGGARSRLHVGLKLTRRDLLIAALVASDNRAVVALGRAAGWTAGEFGAAMTAYARAAGWRSASFEEPTGLGKRNVASARDVLAILQRALDHPILGPIASLRRAEIRPIGKTWTVEYHHTNRIARRARWNVLGGKTGYIAVAGYCLAMVLRAPESAGGARIGMVFLGARGRLTRYGDFSRVVKYLRRRFGPADDAPDSAAVRRRRGQQVDRDLPDRGVEEEGDGVEAAVDRVGAGGLEGVPRLTPGRAEDHPRAFAE